MSIWWRFHNKRLIDIMSRSSKSQKQQNDFNFNFEDSQALEELIKNQSRELLELFPKNNSRYYVYLHNKYNRQEKTIKIIHTETTFKVFLDPSQPLMELTL